SLLHYVTVGEGTTTVTQADMYLPPMIEIEQLTPNRWQIEMIRDHPTYHGMQITTPLYDEWWLPGNKRREDVDTEELRSFCNPIDNPVIVDGKLYWPENQSWINQAD
ncbi:MAG: hypothetical protein ABEI75_00690, partial [Halobaculum sp.]